jgi:hypothetical protein
MFWSSVEPYTALDWNTTPCRTIEWDGSIEEAADKQHLRNSGHNEVRTELEEESVENKTILWFKKMYQKVREKLHTQTL